MSNILGEKSSEKSATKLISITMLIQLHKTAVHHFTNEDSKAAITTVTQSIVT